MKSAARKNQVVARRNMRAMDDEGIEFQNSFPPALRQLLRQSETDANCLSAIEGTGVIARFEEAFAHLTGAEHAVSICSGTAALQTALLACDLGPGDQVIVSPYGWGQTVAAVVSVGSVPVFADIDPQTYNLDLQSVKAEIGADTRAILVTHFLGHPAKMAPLRRLAREHGLWLIADSSQALGAQIEGQPLGALADISAYSLGRGKALSVGEGGMVVTSDLDLYERAVAVSQHPVRAFRQIEDWDIRRGVEELNLSLRMHPLAAAVGLDRISAVAQTVAERRRAWLRLSQMLYHLPGIEPPVEKEGCRHSFHSYSPSCRGEMERAEIVAGFHRVGLSSAIGPVGTPIHLRNFFQRRESAWIPKAFKAIRPHPSWREGSCPVAEQRCAMEEIVIYEVDKWFALA